MKKLKYKIIKNNKIIYKQTKNNMKKFKVINKKSKMCLDIFWIKMDPN